MVARPYRTIALATLVAGALDLTAACVFGAAIRGVVPTRVFQSVASGLLGKAAYDGGAASAAVGFVLHFAIMGVMVALFVVAAQRWPVLARRPLLWGAAYGVATWVVMNLVVLPLRWPDKYPSTDPAAVATQLFCHVVLVGLSVALITARASRAGDGRAMTA